jgi:hypothetical protein
MAMNFNVPSMIKITPIINGSASISASLVLTDHNRSALQIGENVIEQSNRMANGTLRKYIVSSKKDFSVDWTDVPSVASATVDGKAGAVNIKNYYSNYFQYPQKLDIFYGSSSETFNVFFKDFKLTISKRSSTDYDFYNVSAGWDEI